ncbi:FCD domain-containing protein [Agrobacterium sp. MAFF310724]|jgi:DNA-binding GntR family transcriptional regulator|uniref:GntR C-terminal domain-containing protein n=1 Tax=Agrobacterium deltaense NCPPB 1641 TaxID=1183425 RepID=A0A1S7U7C0_9HYPH|nr:MULTISPECIES: FCD domain-containing protein [Agrobacterium]MDA5241614.1 FCD domain-containing protein [Agrobacterium sp. MAFF310724]MDA5249384.1 FCD domain-containing protein [Agrobacterium sp. MAFF210268]MDO3445730.1 FCD domain-containing protein [Agrobacterium sp. V1]UNZ54253.1 FCD domain-containing protein [Agrobacterium tumefaciens]WFS69879.1 FCD domain-containing protein [Agrobacterium leguminum]
MSADIAVATPKTKNAEQKLPMVDTPRYRSGLVRSAFLIFFSGSSYRYVRVLLSSLDYDQQSQDEHRALLKPCRDRDIDAASAILQRHLLEGSRKLSAAAQSS